MGTQMRVALIYGGRSGEHEVSLRSAASVATGLAGHYEVLPVFVDRRGSWFLQGDTRPLSRQDTPVLLAPTPVDGGRLRSSVDASVVVAPDVFFPLIHGTFGEDGTLQGLLELAGVPFVGSGVLASAVGMDKAVMKALFGHHGLPQVKYEVLTRLDAAQEQQIPARLGLPLFVKPANLGSSVGITKVAEAAALGPAIETALAYDSKVLIESAVHAREIEVSVLGNEEPEVSVPGEIVPDREFYDYDSKYASDSRAVLVIPAPLDPETTQRARLLAADAFRAIEASGYARVDLFLDRASGDLLVNEINTIPGFTSISMFPKLWEATGMRFVDLLSKLITLACERHAQRQRLRFDRGGAPQ